MELRFDSLEELRQFVADISGSEVEVAPAPKKKAAAKKAKPATKKAEPKAEKSEPLPETTQEENTPEAPKVTQLDIRDYVQANFADNVQGIKDMLAHVGSEKISKIPDDLCEKAMASLKGE